MGDPQGTLFAMTPEQGIEEELVRIVRRARETSTYASDTLRVYAYKIIREAVPGMDRAWWDRLMAASASVGAFPRIPDALARPARPEAPEEPEEPRTCQCDDCEEPACQGDCESCDDHGCQQCYGDHYVTDCCGYCRDCGDHPEDTDSDCHSRCGECDHCSECDHYCR